MVEFSKGRGEAPPVRALSRPEQEPTATQPSSSSPGRATTPGGHNSPSAPPTGRSPSSSGFAGRIDGASIADLVQMECMRGLRRAVRVASDDGVGYLFFNAGQIVHARTDHSEGESAAIEILGWHGGTFDPCQEFYEGSPTVGMSWQGLLMAAAQRADEAGRSEHSSVSRMPEPEPEVLEDFELDDETVVPRAAIEARRTGGEQGANVDMSNDEGEELEPGVMRAVRLDSEGNVLGSAGDLGDFPDVAAYSVRLCQLIGEAMGLEDFQGLECRGEDKAMVAYVEQGTVVALEALPQTDLATYKRRAGTGN